MAQGARHRAVGCAGADQELISITRQGPDSPSTALAASGQPQEHLLSLSPQPGLAGAARDRMARNAEAQLSASPTQCGDVLGTSALVNHPASSCLGRGVHQGLAGFGRVQGEQRLVPVPGPPQCPQHHSALLCPVTQSPAPLLAATYASAALAVPSTLAGFSSSPSVPMAHPTLTAQAPHQSRGILLAPWSCASPNPAAPKPCRARGTGPRCTSRPCQGTTSTIIHQPSPHSPVEG